MGVVTELGWPLTVNVVLHRQNIDRVADVLALAEEVGADRVELANTQYYGWAWRNRAALLPSRAQLEAAEVVVRAARERLAPILMTSLATGLALVPLVVLGDRPGHEIEHPLAIVILGGLFTSTLLNLFVTPVLYLRFGKPREGGTRSWARFRRTRPSGAPA